MRLGIQSILHLSLTLNGGFLTRLSRTLGALVIVSRAYRPSQTIHLYLFLSVSSSLNEDWCYIVAYLHPARCNMTAPNYAAHHSKYHKCRL